MTTTNTARQAETDTNDSDVYSFKGSYPAPGSPVRIHWTKRRKEGIALMVRPSSEGDGAIVAFVLGDAPAMIPAHSQTFHPEGSPMAKDEDAYWALEKWA